MTASPPRSGRLALIGLALAALGITWLIIGFFSFPGSDAWGYDYRAYVDAASRLSANGSLYQLETLAGPYRPGPFGLYMYAPPLGVALAPVAGAPLDSAVTAWFLLHIVVLAAACALMPVDTPIRLASFGVAALSFAMTRDLVLGNVSVLLLLPMSAAWRWLDRPLGSIAQAVAIAIRPMLGILLVWQLLRRQWLAVAWTLAAGAFLIAATLPFVGLQGYLDYVTVLRNLSDVTGVTRNDDLSSTVLRLGFAQPWPTLALLVGYGMAIVAVVASLRRDRELGFIVTVTASLLLSPLLWDHYLSMLVLPAAFLAARGQSWGLVLPLLSWLPGAVLPVVVGGAVWLPFLTDDTKPMPEPAV